ncbi:hypothetical protein ACFLZ4_00725 [Patescibacteria group bacterium]
MVKDKILKITSNKYFRIVLLVIIFSFAVEKRLRYFTQTSKDIYAYERAIHDLFGGVNPYEWTIESYSNVDDPTNHGYAYLPGLLYLFSGLYFLHLKSGISLEVLWKIPVLIADISVGLLLVKYFFKKDYFLALIGSLIWFFNPYNFFRTGYTYSDPIPILLMFLAIIFLEKDDVLAGAFLALSIVFKTFPIILIPLFLIKTKNKLKFLTSAALVGLFFSIPFLRSMGDFLTYLNGTIFVHTERFVQGRPFLFYISYFYKVELFQIIPLKLYSLMATLFPFVLIPLLYFVFKVKDKYVLATAAFLNFYLFTPVFNRTYVLWFLPVFIIGAYKFFKKKMYVYLTFVVFYSFMSWYLLQWEDGFHIWRP